MWIHIKYELTKKTWVHGVNLECWSSQGYLRVKQETAGYLWYNLLSNYVIYTFLCVACKGIIVNKI